MRATGIVRRIDELGRIVIPKELRRSFKIREGTPLEIFCGDNGELVLKKYSMLEEVKDFASDICKSISSNLNLPCLVGDKDKILCATNTQKTNYQQKLLSLDVIKIIENRNLIIKNKDEVVKIVEDDDNTYFSQMFMPIVSGGDTFGVIIVFSKEEKLLTESGSLVLKSMASFLDEQLS